MGSCQADLLLVTEHVEEGCLKELLPLNSLRNIAILATRTPLVFIADGNTSGLVPFRLLILAVQLLTVLLQVIFLCQNPFPCS